MSAALTARDLMTPAPTTIRTSMKVRDAVDLLQTMDLRHLPVVDEKMKCVGMFSDRALRALFLQSSHAEASPLEATVENFVSKSRCVRDSMRLTQVVDRLLDDHVGALSVTDSTGCVVGIISYVDVLRALALGGAAVESWE